MKLLLVLFSGLLFWLIPVAQFSTLQAQPAGKPLALNSQVSTRKVLDLDGTGSYVELPPNILNDLDEATVEAWVKWRTFPGTDSSRFFSYGENQHDAGIQADGNGMLSFFVVDRHQGEKTCLSER